MGTKLEGGHTQSILCVTFAGQGQDQVVSGGEAGELCLWTPEGAIGHVKKVNDTGDDVTSLCSSRLRPHELYVACGQNIYLFDTRSLDKPLCTFEYNEEEINQISLNEKETFLAACDDSGIIRAINLQDKKVFKTMRKHTNICSTVAFRPRRPWDLISGGLDSQLIHWDFSRGRSVCIIDIQELCTKQEADSYLVNPPFIHSMALSKTGNILACGTENALIQIFNSSKRNLEFCRTLYGHTQGVSQVHFPNIEGVPESLLVTGGNDGQILIWEIQDWVGGHRMTNGTCHGHVGNGHEASPDFVAQEGAQSENIVPRVSLNHGEKVNWLASGMLHNHKVIVVADNTPDLSVYPMPDA